jgi:hypothetical protein
MISPLGRERKNFSRSTEVNLMSSVSSVSSSPPIVPQLKAAPQVLTTAPSARPTDGDTAAQEAAESNSSKRAEKQGGGFAPAPVSPALNSPGAVNKIV